MSDKTDIVERLRELLTKATPAGQWKAGRADVAWYNAAGEQQANVYHSTEADGLHIGQPLPLTIATFGTGRLGLADPQAHAELVAAAVNALPDLLDEITRLREQLAYFGKLHEDEHARLTAELERLRAAKAEWRTALQEWVTLAEIGSTEKWKQGDGTPAISSLWREMAKRSRARLEKDK